MPSKTKDILLVMLEFDNWEQGRSWSYTGAYAFLDGLRENGHRCTLLPALHGRAPDAPDSTIHRAPELLAGKTFDEAWVWCNHAVFDDTFWSWLKTVAPVRIGVVLESLNHSQDELEALPFLAKRKDDAFACLPHCTHAIAADEADVAEIASVFGIPALWNVFMVPQRFVLDLPPPAGDVASFIGAGYFTGPAYNFPKAPNLPRNRFLRDERLNGLMDRPHFRLPERSSEALPRFESLHRDARSALAEGRMDSAGLAAYGDALIELRGEIFAMFLDGLRLGMACVNLPTLVKAFSGRVIEAMAAGVPSVSWLPPDRPACAALFDDGEDLLLFSTVEDLIERLQALRADPKLRQRLVTHARQTLLRLHTSEIRCRQYGDWIDRGARPDFRTGT